MLKRVLAGISILVVTGSLAAAEQPVAPNGIALYPEYMNWQVIAPSYREDKGHIRVITGNDIAVKAMKAGKQPLPDGSVLAKVAWKAGKNPS